MLVDGQVSVELIKDKKHASSSKKAAGASSLKTPARTPEGWASRQWGDTPLELKLTLYRDAKVTAPPQACTPIALSCGSERQNLRPSLSLSRSLACMHTHSVVLSCAVSLSRYLSLSLSLATGLFSAEAVCAAAPGRVPRRPGQSRGGVRARRGHVCPPRCAPPPSRLSLFLSRFLLCARGFAVFTACFFSRVDQSP